MARLLENWGSIHWRDSRPIHAADSHPFMTLDWGNPADTANRRLHLRDFYQYHGVEHGYEQLFDACERDVCKMLRSFGESTLSELKFNYYVDLVVWRRTCKLILNLSHEIPLVLTCQSILLSPLNSPSGPSVESATALMNAARPLRSTATFWRKNAKQRPPPAPRLSPPLLRKLKLRLRSMSTQKRAMLSWRRPRAPRRWT